MAFWTFLRIHSPEEIPSSSFFYRPAASRPLGGLLALPPTSSCIELQVGILRPLPVLSRVHTTLKNAPAWLSVSTRTLLHCLGTGCGEPPPSKLRGQGPPLSYTNGRSRPRDCPPCAQAPFPHSPPGSFARPSTHTLPPSLIYALPSARIPRPSSRFLNLS